MPNPYSDLSQVTNLTHVILKLAKPEDNWKDQALFDSRAQSRRMRFFSRTIFKGFFASLFLIIEAQDNRYWKNIYLLLGLRLRFLFTSNYI